MTISKNINDEICECGHTRKEHTEDYDGRKSCINCTCPNFKPKNPKFTTCRECGASHICATAITNHFTGCERYDKTKKEIEVFECGKNGMRRVPPKKSFWG